MSNAPDTGSTPSPSDWDRSTDSLQAIKPGQAADRKPSQGIVVKFFGHRFAIPLASVMAAVVAACGITYEAADRHLEAYKVKIAALEERADKLESAQALNSQSLAQIQASLARIDARVAEVQVTLMRRR